MARSMPRRMCDAQTAFQESGCLTALQENGWATDTYRGGILAHGRRKIARRIIQPVSLEMMRPYSGTGEFDQATHTGDMIKVSMSNENVRQRNSVKSLFKLSARISRIDDNGVFVFIIDHKIAVGFYRSHDEGSYVQSH